MHDPLDLKHELSLLRAALGLSRRESLRLVGRLRELGGLRGLWNGRSEALESVLAPGAKARLDAIFELIDRLFDAPLPPARIESAEEAAQYFRTRLGLDPSESFWVLLLDSRGRVIGEECVSLGTVNACLVHPREIFAPALRARAAQILVVHNHPSGDQTPSPEDYKLTDRLSEAGTLLGIPMVDHLIVSRLGHKSIGQPQKLARVGAGKTPMWEELWAEDRSMRASRDPPSVRGSPPE